MKQILDFVWNLKALKGHRSKIAETGLMLTAGIIAYQGLATDSGLIGSGIDLPDLSPAILTTVGVIAAFLAKKMKQFVTEHK